jgi:thiol-disulfide isomerase/thioredoxin
MQKNGAELTKDSRMITIRCLTLLGLFTVIGAALGQTRDEKKITAVPVKYDGLKQEILKHRGKVVLVDFWGTFCPPCMASFPKYIAMQQKYGDKGLVVVTVSLDDVLDKDEGAETLARVNRFLTKQQSPLHNLVLHESSELWRMKLGCDALPCYFVFDRQGKWVRFRAQDTKEGVDPADVEKTIVQMLNEK